MRLQYTSKVKVGVYRAVLSNGMLESGAYLPYSRNTKFSELGLRGCEQEILDSQKKHEFKSLLGFGKYAHVNSPYNANKRSDEIQ